MRYVSLLSSLIFFSLSSSLFLCVFVVVDDEYVIICRMQAAGAILRFFSFFVCHFYTDFVYGS